MTGVVVGVFVWVLGLCVGSFLNVVVHRLPAGLSLCDPVRSFCPSCRAGIRWYDNLPVLSWLLLRARCRQCRAAISVQYPLVEALTGLVFVLVYYLLFVADARAGLGSVWPRDIPLLAAWLVLAGALIACSALDVTMYMVDTRVTDVALGLGVLLHAVWPRQGFFESRVATPAAAAALAAFVTSGVMLWLTVWRVPARAGEAADDDEAGGGAPADAAEPAPASRGAALGGLLAALLFVGLSVWLVYAGAFAAAVGSSAARLIVPLSLSAIFVVTALVGGQQRAADEEIHNAIEEERPQARRTALRELLWLGPALGAGVVTYWVVGRVPAVADAWSAVTAWPGSSGFAPLGGAVFAVHGAMVGAAAGWVLRIVFTLAFGREAFGIGDVYILAAAGAATGWDIVLLGLLLAVGLALAGWLLGLVLKRGVMIPFGPWLALGFLVALWLNRAANDALTSYARDVLSPLAARPDLLMMLAGLLLVAFGAAVILARLVRVWVERMTS